MKQSSNTETELKKEVAYKKKRVFVDHPNVNEDVDLSVRVRSLRQHTDHILSCLPALLWFNF